MPKITFNTHQPVPVKLQPPMTAAALIALVLLLLGAWWLVAVIAGAVAFVAVFAMTNSQVGPEEVKTVEVEAGTNLRKAAMQNGIPVYKGVDQLLNCRGMGLCGTCKVLVKQGADNVNPKTAVEKFNFNFHPLSMLASIGNEDEMRLSCQVAVNGDCTVVTTPALNWSGENFWQKPYPNK